MIPLVRNRTLLWNQSGFMFLSISTTSALSSWQRWQE